MSTRPSILVIAALSGVVAGRQGSTAAAGDADDLSAEVARLDAELTELRSTARRADALLEYVSVNEAGDVVFTGTNVRIQSGSGSTDDGGRLTGKGNLIVGYDEGDGSDDKTGSHNLVVGPYHSYTGSGGFVAGWDNEVAGLSAAVSGGSYNRAVGDMSVVSGGFSNGAESRYASLLGGLFQVVQGEYAVEAGDRSPDPVPVMAVAELMSPGTMVAGPLVYAWR